MNERVEHAVGFRRTISAGLYLRLVHCCVSFIIVMVQVVQTDKAWVYCKGQRDNNVNEKTNRSLANNSRETLSIEGIAYIIHMHILWYIPYALGWRIWSTPVTTYLIFWIVWSFIVDDTLNAIGVLYWMSTNGNLWSHLWRKRSACPINYDERFACGVKDEDGNLL